MPNGATKNWVRLCAAIDGFRVRYKSSPSRIIIGELEYENLKEVFLPETFSLIEQKLKFVIIKGLGMAAEDQQGRRYDYAKKGFCRTKPDINARDWLGVEPDSPLAID
jgi:hypothetical protein